MRWIIRGLSLLICAVALLMTAAASDSPVGKWKTFDDKTGRVKSIVQITEENGELTGKVLQVLESPYRAASALPTVRRRTKRSTRRRDDDFVGREKGWSFVGGRSKFSIRRTVRFIASSLTPLDGGQKLEVHGYIGIPCHRSQADLATAGVAIVKANEST